MKRTKNILSYPAIFSPITDKGFKGGFNVSFPDFPGCVTFGNSFEEAEKMAEEAVSCVKGNVFHRKDIGTKELIDKRIRHMKKNFS